MAFLPCNQSQTYKNIERLCQHSQQFANFENAQTLTTTNGFECQNRTDQPGACGLPGFCPNKILQRMRRELARYKVGIDATTNLGYGRAFYLLLRLLVKVLKKAEGEVE